MDDKTYKILDKLESKQLLLSSQDKRAQVIVEQVTSTKLVLRFIQGFAQFNPKFGDDVTLIYDIWYFNCRVTEVNEKIKQVWIEVKEDVKRFMNRNYVRVDAYLKGLLTLKEQNGFSGRLYMPETKDWLEGIMNTDDIFHTIYIVDLSGGGFAFKTEMKIETGTRLVFDYEKVGTVGCIIRHRRKHLKKTGNVYQYGVQFEDMPIKYRDVIIEKVFELLTEKKRK